MQGRGFAGSRRTSAERSSSCILQRSSRQARRAMSASMATARGARARVPMLSKAAPHWWWRRRGGMMVVGAMMAQAGRPRSAKWGCLLSCKSLKPPWATPVPCSGSRGAKSPSSLRSLSSGDEEGSLPAYSFFPVIPTTISTICFLLCMRKHWAPRQPAVPHNKNAVLCVWWPERKVKVGRGGVQCNRLYAAASKKKFEVLACYGRRRHCGCLFSNCLYMSLQYLLRMMK